MKTSRLKSEVNTSLLAAGCFIWGEALALGPNINVTNNGQAVLSPEAHFQAFAAMS
ncbi:hypothetical protein [Nitrosomonas sp. wSCUT-2]